MRVIHDAEDVAERVDDGGGDKPRAMVLGRLKLGRAHREQAVERGRHIVDVPVHDHTGRPGRRTGRCVAAIDDAQLVLVVTEAELDIRRRAGLRALELWSDAQELGVPRLRRLEIGGPKV